LKWQHYACSGLRISSALSIPEWAVFEKAEGFGPPDVWIRVEKPALETDPSGNVPFISENECRFFFPEVGEYYIRKGQEIIIRPMSKAGAREVRLFLLGTAWGALSYQRGLLMLHAGAVKIGDQVVAFCGPAGSGKSTLTAWLTRNGRPLVSDDLCRFDVTNDLQPVIYPSAPRLKLWRDALSAIGWEHQKLERDYFRLDKFHLPQDREGLLKPLPLSAIYLLGWGKLGIKRLKGVNAVRDLVASATYHGELLAPMGRLATHWERCTEVVRRVPVWKFTRPRGLWGMEKAVGLLESRS
jgi:hypothetical protein